jgi:hypothetical protein
MVTSTNSVESRIAVVPAPPRIHSLPSGKTTDAAYALFVNNVVAGFQLRLRGPMLLILIVIIFKKVGRAGDKTRDLSDFFLFFDQSTSASVLFPRQEIFSQNWLFLLKNSQVILH